MKVYRFGIRLIGNKLPIILHYGLVVNSEQRTTSSDKTRQLPHRVFSLTAFLSNKERKVLSFDLNCTKTRPGVAGELRALSNP